MKYKFGRSRKFRVSTEPSVEEMEISADELREALMGSEVAAAGVDKGVEINDNRLYFYAPVTESSVLEFTKLLHALDVEMQHLAIRLGVKDVPIQVHIHSGGGDLFAGLAAVDAILSTKSSVHTYILGQAASAATLMSLVGKQRFIHRNSFMLIHQLSSFMLQGTHEQFKDEFENQERLMEQIKRIYREHAGMDDDTLEDLLKHDLWLNAERCLDLGLVDEVV